MAEALANYDAAVFIGEGDQAAADAVRASRERAAQIDRVVARLALVFATPPPAGVEVRVDDARVDPARLGDPIALDAGHHLVTASAPGLEPFRTGVTLPEGGQVSITVELRPLTPGDQHRGPAPTGELQEGSAPAKPNRPTSTRTAGYVAFGIGGALAVGSVVSLVLRAVNMATLTGDCSKVSPSGDQLKCPAAHFADDKAAHDAARIQGPLGIGLGLGAAVAAGVGVWLVVRTPSGTRESTDPGLRLGVMLVPQGGGIVLCSPL
jgi:hypothetical protein